MTPAPHQSSGLEIEPCPSCGALPCDWAAGATFKPDLIVDPTTAAKTLRALGLLTDADVGPIGNTLAARERVRQGGQGA